jgi:hypothetical protein
MNKKTAFYGLLISATVLVIACFSREQPPDRVPIIFTSASGSYEDLSLDDLIFRSNLIAIGTFHFIPPSQWNTPNGQLPAGATSETVWELDLFIYTEQVFSPTEILKADPLKREILVRSFGGQVGQDVMEVSSSEPAYTTGQKYLLFLSYYPDRVADDTPGYYLDTGYYGMYEIVNGRAISIHDEWNLDELVTYIKESELSKVDVSDTPDTETVMHQIEIATTIEKACDFEFSKFPSVYANDIHYPVDDKKLEFIKTATDNPSLESAGYLDYKIAYHSWWLEGKRQWKELYEKAQAENRPISEAEQKEFLESKWGTFPGSWCSPVKSSQLRFISITFEDNIATAVIGVNSRTREVILISLNGQWLIVQEKELLQYP